MKIIKNRSESIIKPFLEDFADKFQSLQLMKDHAHVHVFQTLIHRYISILEPKYILWIRHFSR